LRGVTDRCSAFGVAPPVTHALGPGKTVAAALTAAARMRKSAKERKQRIVEDGTVR
jgi:hypothetical protein